LPAVRQAINLLIKEYPNDTHFIEAKDRLLSAYLDKEADQPYPIDLPHETWKKSGIMDDQSPLLDDHLQALPPIASWEKREDAYAVIVGVNRYQFLRARHFADRDARHVQRMLVQRGLFKNDVEHVRLRVDQEANLSTIRDDLRWLVRQGQLNPGAILLFYFAGWGTPQVLDGKVDDALLLPAESRPDGINPQSALSLSALRESLETVKNAQVAVILDSCFNDHADCSVQVRSGVGGGSLSLPRAALGEGLTDEFFQGRAAWLVSSLHKQSGLHGPGRQGNLTYFLLKGLLGEADGLGAPADGWVDLAELHLYLQKQMPDSGLFLSKSLKMRLTKSKGER
jgi:hypothetical protein